VFHDFHHENYPLIVFHAKTEAVQMLIDSAKKAGVGICNHDDGAIMVQANDIWKIHGFAKLIIEG